MSFHTTSLYYWWDAHGNQNASSCQTYGCMGTETYGNTITSQTGTGSCGVFDRRGGLNMDFNNTIITSATVSCRYREEYEDDDWCNDTTPPQHVSSSYSWNILKNTTQISATCSAGCCPGLDSCITEDTDWSTYEASFDGSTGVGVGPYSSIPGTCTPYVAYWASDRNILYRCTATNTWTNYYRPYIYPHHFVTEMIRPYAVEMTKVAADFSRLQSR
jgi:hypothetical protein